MTTEVSSEILVTRDLLGELSKDCNKDLDQNLRLSGGWDISPLNDSKFGITQPQISKRSHCQDSQLSPSSSFNKDKYHYNKLIINSELPQSSPLEIFSQENCNLELKLNPSNHYCYYPSQSVCTLDKVKSALQRAEKSERKRRLNEGEEKEEERVTSLSKKALLFATGCPGCLLYVVTSKANPKCPRCNFVVPFDDPLVVKKPRIDLNNAFPLI